MIGTGVKWLDDLAEFFRAAGFPERVDRETAPLIVEPVLGHLISSHEIRTWPVEYKVVSRKAVYKIVDLIAHARELVETAPPRTGAPQKPRCNLTPAAPRARSRRRSPATASTPL